MSVIPDGWTGYRLPLGSPDLAAYQGWFVRAAQATSARDLLVFLSQQRPVVPEDPC